MKVPGELCHYGVPVPLSERWFHLTDETECVAGRIYCDVHDRWECAQSHDPVGGFVPDPA